MNIDTYTDALQLLKKGNEKYLSAQRSDADISPQLRLNTFKNGQKPYAAIISCSDSRVIPECIFSVGIGELFVIRSAGNTVDSATLGSIEYAISSLKLKLIIIMGHTGCGAINAAIRGSANGYIKIITDKIRLAINDEQDACIASRQNVIANVREVRRLFADSNPDVKVIGAIYHTDTGEVDFIDV